MMRGKARRLWSALTVVLVSAVIATMAVLYQGYTTADVELNDGGVWVYTGTPSSIIGHLNYPSRTLDAVVLNIRTDIELFQDGNTVATYEESSGTLSNVDVPTAALDGDGALTPGSKVALRAGAVGIVDAATGGLFTSPTSAIKGLTLNGRDPVSKLGVGAQVTVDVAGTVHAVSVEKSELVSMTKQGALATKQFEAFVPKAAITITAVGTTPVVLDSANGIVYTPDRVIQVPDAKGGILQSASAANDRVLIATTAGLVTQPLDGSAAVVTTVAAGGVPSAPVWLDGCGYAVWSGSAAYVRDCPETAADVNQVITEVGPDPKLVLRQNRHVVVINELVSGTTWLINENMIKVDNWLEVIPPDSEEGDEDESQDEQPLFKIPERSAKNHKPTANPDQYGVRAGSTAILPVLENDTDPDGDLLAASLQGQTPATAIVQTVQGGAALQVAVGENAVGDVSFTYLVDDGREDGTAEAKVTLHVRPASANSPPAQQKVQTLPLEVGATVTYDALLGWRDPESDDLYLKRAWTDGDDKVTFRNNGVIQFTEATGERGIHEVQLLVSDGTDEYQGILRVDVRAKGSLAPVVSADRYSTLVGQPITVSPLDNDRSGSGKQLRLAKVEQVANAKVSPPDTGGTFTFTGNQPGAFYIGYLTTDGPNTSAGIVRVDVLAQSKDGLPPLAARDTALLPTGREVLVDVLANDTDPMGSILVLQSVTVPRGSKVSAEILEHRILRIKDVGQLDGPTTISYRVSNGAQWAEGEVRVLPVGLPEKLQPPTTQQDKAVVRAGDVVTVDVLANDYHPDGDRLTLMPELKEAPAPADGTAFLSENRVRFKAALTDEPKSVSVVYEVTDSQDNVTAGYLTIQVIPADAETNSPPKPSPVTARVVAGTSVRVPIPLDGIDQNGDSVELIGTASTPKKGRVSVGDSWLVYEAYPGVTGRDDLEYLVRDRYGATATGSLVVGIVLPSTQNQPPYTAGDQVTVRPGREVSVAVLQNDSDPDGDEVALSSKGLTTPDGVSAEVVKSRVLVHAPKTEGTYSFTYRAVDPYGAKSEGVLAVEVDPDAPLRSPIARDDHVQPAQLGEGATIDVAVLENDEDPDGVVESLKVTTDNPDVVVRADGGLTIPVTPQSQLVLYTVTDVDGKTGSAVVFVPGSDALLPTLKDTKPIEVVSGKTVAIALNDYVLVREDHKARISTADSVRAGHANGDDLIVDEANLSYTSVKDYFGPDAVSVEVTDGTGPEDEKGHFATIAIPIQVIPASNQSPTLAGTSVMVAPGEDAVTVDLRKLATDPNPGDLEKLTFNVVGSPSAGIRAQLDGSTLTVSADSNAERNRVGEIEVSASDGSSAPAKAKIQVNVTASQRELPSAMNDIVRKADQGQPVTIDVLKNDHNPFKDTPLTVVSATRTSGRGKVSTDGTKVTITPDADFVGSMTANYRIQDATRTSEREAEATVTVIVQGRPDQPGRPMVTTVGDQMAVLSWSPPANNGRPITGYTVTSSTKKYTKKCSATTCTLDKLTNDVEYTFTVVATNDVGDSDPSPASAVARPDARPDTPAPPTLKFGDRQLEVAWKTPKTHGSPVLSYNLEISPAPEAGALQKVGVTGNSMTWTGLKNGTAYQVKVQAVNRAPEPSEWSQYSASEIPATVPDPPGTPKTTPAKAVGGQAQLSISWSAPADDGGDAVAGYTLYVRHGSSTDTINTSDNSQNITVDPSQTDYTFTVTAKNKAGDSKQSAASAPRRAAIAPGAPASVTAKPGDKELKVDLTAGELNGNKAGELTYHYTVSPGGASGTMSASGKTIGGLSNGTDYTVKVWATSDVAGVDPGKSTTSNEVRPFGKPIITLVSSERLDKAVKFTWKVDKNGRNFTSENPGVDGSGNGSKTVSGLADGATGSIDVSYTNEAGTTTAHWEERANDPPPPPSVSVYRGDNQGPCPVAGPGDCFEVGVRTANFTGNVSCTLDGGYSTTYGPNDSKIIGGNYRPWRGLNIVFTINCGGVTWSGKMP